MNDAAAKNEFGPFLCEIAKPRELHGSDVIRVRATWRRLT
jgi:hypothetical protein